MTSLETRAGGKHEAGERSDYRPGPEEMASENRPIIQGRFPLIALIHFAEPTKLEIRRWQKATA
jgi:hypothetical protein